MPLLARGRACYIQLSACTSQPLELNEHRSPHWTELLQMDVEIRMLNEKTCSRLLAKCRLLAEWGDCLDNCSLSGRVIILAHRWPVMGWLESRRQKKNVVSACCIIMIIIIISGSGIFFILLFYFLCGWHRPSIWPGKQRCLSPCLCYWCIWSVTSGYGP